MTTSEKVVLFGDYAPTDAITTDFEKLLTKFTNTKSVRYEWFLQIWKEMSMSLFYAGRLNDRECREFTEECLRIASNYIQPPYQFQVRVCGLYLLYALYFRHPFEPKVKIRITLDEWKELLLFVAEIRHQQHFDVDYVFMKLRHDRAFHFVAAKAELYMGIRGISDTAAEVQKQKVEVIVEQMSAISSIFQSDAIEELSTIHEEYHRYKCGLAGVNASQPGPSFNIINASLVHDITKIVASHENWRKNKIGKKTSNRRRRDSSHTNSESEGESEQDQPASPSSSPQKSGKSIYAIRQEIKDRAFSTTGIATQSRRHRQAHVISEVNAEAATGTPKRGRKSHSGDQQEHASSEQLCSPKIIEQTEIKEVSAFGAFISPQKDEPGVILSMPDLLCSEASNKEKRKRKISEATALNKTPKKDSNKPGKNKKSPKNRKQKSTPNPKQQRDIPDPAEQQAFPDPSKQQTITDAEHLQNTSGPEKQQETPDLSKRQPSSGSKKKQKTPKVKKPQSASDPPKQLLSSDSEHLQNTSGPEQRQEMPDLSKQQPSFGSKKQKTPKVKKPQSTSDPPKQLLDSDSEHLQNTYGPEQQQEMPHLTKQQSSSDSKKQKTPKVKKPQSVPDPPKQLLSSDSEHLQNTGLEQQQEMPDLSKQQPSSGSKKKQKTPKVKKPQSAPYPPKQLLNSDSEHLQSTSGLEQQQETPHLTKQQSSSDSKKQKTATVKKPQFTSDPTDQNSLSAALKSGKKRGRPRKQSNLVSDQEKPRKMPKMEDGYNAC